MIYKHPENPKIIWEDGKRGRPPQWVTALRAKKGIKKTIAPKTKKPKPVSDTDVVGNLDPLAKTNGILTDGSYRVNGRVIYVGPDCEFPVCAGDRIRKIG